jgi:hypothetical protein
MEATCDDVTIATDNDVTKVPSINRISALKCKHGHIEKATSTEEEESKE